MPEPGFIGGFGLTGSRPSTPDPSQSDQWAGQNVSTKIASTEQGLGVDYWGGTGAQYEGDVLDMQTAGRTNVGRITLPPGVGAGDFKTLLSYAEAFAASAGWRYYPTSQQFNQMMQQGLYRSNQSDVFKWLAQTNGVAKTMPWAAAGMDHTTYTSTKDQIESTIADYTGDPNTFPDLVQQALARGSGGTAWLHTQLTTNKTYTENAKTPWLKFGMTYQTWQGYKRDSRAKVQAQFGANATEAQYASAYQEAAPSRQVSGGATTLPSGSNALVSSGNQSQVR